MTDFNFTPYHYKAKVISVYDGDTITVDVDLGGYIHTTWKIRFARINAWEIRGKEREKGLIALDWLRSRLPVGSLIYLKTFKDKTGKYGRYIAEVYDNCFENINEELVELGHAKYQKY